MTSPRDGFVTVYGRRPVLEVLSDDALTVDKVAVAANARGREIDDIVAAASRRGIEVRRVAPAQVTRLSRNGRQDQGVVADVVAPRMAALDEWVGTAPASADVLVLDGLTNPQNVGLIVRTAVAAGLTGVVVPRSGVAEIGPLVIKASAGLAFSAPIIRAPDAATAVDGLRGAGFRIYGLAATADRLLFDHMPFAPRSAFVLGGEHQGLSVAVDETVAIPMAGAVDSLNVAVAAGILCFELVRRSIA